MTPTAEIEKTLSPGQIKAIDIIKANLDCFNSRDGCGLFVGMGRYNVLTARVELAAAKSLTLFNFWSALTRYMRWPPPNARGAHIILTALTVKDADEESEALRALQRDTTPIVAIARVKHADDKEQRRALLYDADDGHAPQPPADPTLNDTIDDIFKVDHAGA